MTTDERRRDQRLQKKTKKHFDVPFQHPLPLPLRAPPCSLSGTAVEDAVGCAQQVPANSSETVKTNQRRSSVCADEGSKARLLTHEKNTARRDDEIKWNFYCIGLPLSVPPCSAAA